MTTESPASIGRRFVDVSSLPRIAFGHRDPLWWGVWLLITIEGTMFALVVGAYFYIRGNYEEWPPPGVVQPSLAITGATVLALILSGLAMIPAFRAALHGRLRIIQFSMVATTLFCLAAVVLRGYELASFKYFWNSHTYGSLVWTLYFLHTLHLAAGLVENAAFTTLVFVGPVEKKHMLDVRVSALYWWFVVVSWIVLWALIFGDSRFFR